MEQLNIEGKRSGDGFVTHKAMLVSALTRALAARVVVSNITIGTKGFLAYLKALGGSNVVKVIPATTQASSTGNASPDVSGQVASKGLKVVCGANASYLTEGAWIKNGTSSGRGIRGGTPLTFCEVRVSPATAVKPNIGANELAHALNRVLPFTSTDSNRKIQQCISVEAKDGKLVLVATDGFSLADVSLPYDEDEGNALIDRESLIGVASALKRANRVKVGFEPSGDKLDGTSLVVDTELIRYKWRSAEGQFPEWRKLIPEGFAVSAQFDTTEAIRAVNSLKALTGTKGYCIDLTVNGGKVVLSDADGKGTAELPADTSGEGGTRIDGRYLIQSLKACGGIVEFALNNGYSPMQFRTNGYQILVMPMITDEARAQAERDRKANTQPAEPTTTATPPTEPTRSEPVEAKVTAVAQAEAIAKAHKPVKPNKPAPVVSKANPKPAHKAKQPVAA